MRIRVGGVVNQHVVTNGCPDGPAVVFANSLGTNLEIWNQVVSGLPPGWQIVRYDMRGHGKTSCPVAPYSIEELVEDATAVLESLSVTKCLFVGLSIGGLVGQQLALEKPELVAGLVLSNTAPRLGNHAFWNDRISRVTEHGLRFMADEVISRWFSAEFLRSHPERVQCAKEMLSSTQSEGYVGCCHVLRDTDLTARASEISCRIRVIGGSEDGAVPPQVVIAGSREFAEAECTILESTGHLSCVEKPHRVSTLLQQFASELQLFRACMTSLKR